MPLFTLLSTFLGPIFGKIFDVGRDVTKSLFDFFSSNGKLFVKWGLFIFIINLFFTILSFFLYSIYYGGAYILSHFVTQTTLNIIHMGFLGSIVYFIYKFMYKDNN